MDIKFGKQYKCIRNGIFEFNADDENVLYVPTRLEGGRVYMREDGGEEEIGNLDVKEFDYFFTKV